MTRGGSSRLDHRGYLFDPESPNGPVFNPEVAPLDAKSVVPCLVLLGEPGMGKSTVLDQHLAGIHRRARLSGGSMHRADLKTFQSDVRLQRAIFEAEVFRCWRAGSQVMHLVLDSLDQCLIRIDTVA